MLNVKIRRQTYVESGKIEAPGTQPIYGSTKLTFCSGAVSSETTLWSVVESRTFFRMHRRFLNVSALSKAFPAAFLLSSETPDPKRRLYLPESKVSANESLIESGSTAVKFYRFN